MCRLRQYTSVEPHTSRHINVHSGTVYQFYFFHDLFAPNVQE